MAKLTDFITKEELEQLWPYRHGREEGRREGHREGHEVGHEIGREETLYALLSNLLSQRFGPLPAWAQARLHQITTTEEAGVIIRRLPTATDLQGILAPPRET